MEKKWGEGKKYKKKIKGYRELCERKRKEENGKWEKMAMEAKRENEVREIINRERKRSKRINEGIEMGEWKEYFMRLLVEGKVVKVRERRKREKGGEEEEISRKEIRKAIKRLKDRKEIGMDKMPSKAWRYEGEEMEE